MLPLPGLSPVSGKRVEVKFDGGLLSSDGGVLALREVDQRLRVADRLAACMVDRRAPDQITHSLADIIRFRLLMIAAGYEDGNDANCLRSDPMFKMALDLSVGSRTVLAVDDLAVGKSAGGSRPVADGSRDGRSLLRVLYKVPKRITLDIDDTFDAVHGGQQLRLFNAHYDEYGFQPIVVFDGEGRFVTAVLRPAKRPSGKEIKPFLRRLLRAIRAHWPNTEICCAPTATTAAPRFRLVSGERPRLHPRRRADYDVAPACRKSRSQCKGTVRSRAQRRQASSFQRVLRRRAKLEPGRADHRPGRSGRGRISTRFVVTNLNKRNARVLYEDVYCRRGQAENHIKSWKTHLGSDRTSCTKATANQFRLFLHAGAYWLMWGLRASMPRRSMWRVAQFDTLRLRLVKIAARVVEMKTMIRVHLPTSCPGQEILRFALQRIPRLVT